MNNSTKYLFGALILTVGVVGVSFYSCEKEEITPNEFTPEVIQELDSDATNTERTETNVRPSAEEHLSPEPFFDANYNFIEPEALCGKPFTNKIIDAKNKEIGTAYTFNTDKNLYVWLVVNDGYKMKSANLHMGMNVKYFPWNEDRTLAHDAFKYSFPSDRKISRVLDFKIPIHQLNGESLVAVTAEFQNPLGNWGRAWVVDFAVMGEVKGPFYKYKEQKCTVDPTHPGTPENNDSDI